MSRKASLPDWASVIKPGRIEVQAAAFYPEYLEELGVAKADVDQYWLAVAFNFMKMDVQVATAGTDVGAPAGGALEILVNDTTKSADKPSIWALRVHPEGRGESLGLREAKEHYRRLRGMVPA